MRAICSEFLLWQYFNEDNLTQIFFQKLNSHWSGMKFLQKLELDWNFKRYSAI